MFISVICKIFALSFVRLSLFAAFWLKIQLLTSMSCPTFMFDILVVFGSLANSFIKLMLTSLSCPVFVDELVHIFSLLFGVTLISLYESKTPKSDTLHSSSNFFDRFPEIPARVFFGGRMGGTTFDASSTALISTNVPAFESNAAASGKILCNLIWICR